MLRRIAGTASAVCFILSMVGPGFAAEEKKPAAPETSVKKDVPANPCAAGGKEQKKPAKKKPAKKKPAKKKDPEKGMVPGPVEK